MREAMSVSGALTRNFHDLHPGYLDRKTRVEYVVKWNGAIDAQLERSEQRQPPLERIVTTKDALQSYDKEDIRKAARRLRAFTIRELHEALNGDYSIATLEHELSYWKNLTITELDSDSTHNRYRYVTLEDLGQRNWLHPQAPKDAA